MTTTTATPIAYATSKEVHSALKKALSPWFIAQGWKRRAGYTCAFVRPADTGGFWCLWLQPSSWGGRLSGSSFTVNLVHVDAADAPLAGGPHARVLMTLSEADRQRAHGLAQELALRIPDPAPTDPVHEWARLPGHEGETWRQRLADLRTVNPDAWKPGVDMWLPYYALADLQVWVDFLAPRWEHLLRQSRSQQTDGQSIPP